MTLTQQKILNQVKQIRNDVQVFLTDTAQILRKTGTAYIEGESRPIYANPETFICRLITRSGSSSHNIAAQAREIQQTTFTGLYRMQVLYTLEVSEDDRIMHTDVDSGDVKTFEIQFAPQRHNMMGARILILQEVK